MRAALLGSIALREYCAPSRFGTIYQAANYVTETAPQALESARGNRPIGVESGSEIDEELCLKRTSIIGVDYGAR